jgi:hypothetical protein
MQQLLTETNTDATEHPMDLDSHANTCLVGKNALFVHVSNKKVNATEFDPTLGKVKDLDLLSAALSYDCPDTGETVILMAHQAVHVPTMTNDLLCPTQMRVNEIGIQECPKFLTQQHLDDITHTLSINQDGEELMIPLVLQGVVVSYLPTQKPTMVEYQT